MASSLAGRFVAMMTVFGSRLQPGADWVQPRFATAEERNKLGHLWVFDTWIANADRRPGNPNLLVSDGRLLAIDHAQGLPWLSGDVPRGTPHVRDGFGADADVLAGDAAARGALERFTSERAVRDVMGCACDMGARRRDEKPGDAAIRVRARNDGWGHDAGVLLGAPGPRDHEVDAIFGALRGR